MGSKKLALEAGGPERLELSWGMFWKNFQVKLDGRTVGTAEGSKQLKEGVQFQLLDGSSLSVQLVTKAFDAELQVLRDGVPLPGSASDPEQRIRNGAYLLYFLAGLNTLLGVVVMAIGNEMLEGLGMGIGSILFGAIVAVLGFFTYRRTRVAPILAIVLYVADSLYTFGTAMGEGGRPPVAGIIIRIYIILALVKAAQAAAELARREKEGPGVSLQP